MKKVYIEKLNEKEQMNALNEIRILASVKSRNIVEYFVLFLYRKVLLIIRIVYALSWSFASKVTSPQLYKQHKIKKFK